MIIRTSAIDRLIGEAVIAGVDTVLNLGAGLDTRPYRMKLPASLRWVELDFPTIVDSKNATLAEHQPVCKLERVGIDLLDRPALIKAIARYGMTSKNTLVITEGVLVYFSVLDAATLASELHAAPCLFEVKDWFKFFRKYGWQSSQVITSFGESQRINRPYPLDFPYGLILRALPKAMSQKILSLSGAVMMQSVARDESGRFVESI